MQITPLSVILTPLLTLTMVGMTYQYISYISICASFKQKITVLMITLLTVFPGLEIASYLGNMSITMNLIASSIIFGVAGVMFEAIKDNAKSEKQYRQQILYKALHYEMLKSQVEAR